MSSEIQLGGNQGKLWKIACKEKSGNLNIALNIWEK